jgi:uncharacterized protein (TIGR00297 family)
MVTISPEDRRQIVHIAMGAWALLLRWISWPQAIALASAALLFNWFVLPRIGGRTLYREADHARGYPLGILLYPFVVLVLILLFRVRLDIVAAVWGVLAAGDGAATIVGRRLPRRRLPWNVEKTASGTAAFIVCGTIASALLGWWVSARFDGPLSVGSLLEWFGMAALATTAAALVETIPVRLDDNISVSAAAALVFASLHISTVSAWSANADDALRRVLLGLLLNALVAAMGWAAKTVSLSGVIAGVVIGTTIFACGGTGAWLLLLLAFAAAALTSRIGYRRKLQLGIAEERGGRRGAANAIANTGFAAGAALLAVISPYRAEALLALTAALAAGSSDTVASEIGKAFGRRTFLVVGFKPVSPGTSGALSLEGTAAGVAAAAVLALVAVRVQLIPPHYLLIVVLAATAASLIESALGATLEGARVLNNDLLNFINTAAAAAIALLLTSRL